MKSYTGIEQSKKLAEFLPLESADMCLNTSQLTDMKPLMTSYCKFKEFFNMEETPDFLIPCWSLATLIELLPRYVEIDKNVTYLDIFKMRYYGYGVEYSNQNDDVSFSFDNQNLIDACYEMIVKLHELKLL